MACCFFFTGDVVTGLSSPLGREMPVAVTTTTRSQTQIQRSAMKMRVLETAKADRSVERDKRD